MLPVASIKSVAANPVNPSPGPVNKIPSPRFNLIYAINSKSSIIAPTPNAESPATKYVIVFFIVATFFSNLGSKNL